MVNYCAGLDATFAALADPTRRAILARLTRSEASVTDLARPFSMSLPAVSKHLTVLERAGLLARTKEGRVHRCRLLPSPIETAADWIAHHQRFWQDRLDSLERYLKQSKEEESWPRPKSKPRPRSGSHARSPRRPRKSSAPGRTRKR